MSSLFRNLSRVLAVGALLLALTACEQHAPVAPPPPPPPASVAGPDTWFPIKIGNQTIRIQLAVDQNEQAHGLMNREQLNPDDGMIFVNEGPQHMSFWMMNTPLPLDVGYLDVNGVLREVYQMYPYNTQPVDSRRSDLRYALEMNQNWFDQHNVRPGDQLDLAALRAALKARGKDPARYTPAP
jgi:hypothetical protein